MVDHACHRPSTTVLRIYPQKEQLGIFFLALQKLILGPNQKQMGLTLGVYIYICPNGHFMPLFMAIFMAYTPPHSHWMRDTMIKVIWRLPGRQVASPQGIEKRDRYESWVFDKENLHITVATKLKLILNLIRQADVEADHVDTPWQCDRHQLDSLVIGQVYACEHKPTERPMVWSSVVLPCSTPLLRSNSWWLGVGLKSSKILKLDGYSLKNSQSICTLAPGIVFPRCAAPSAPEPRRLGLPPGRAWLKMIDAMHGMIQWPTFCCPQTVYACLSCGANYR